MDNKIENGNGECAKVTTTRPLKKTTAEGHQQVFNKFGHFSIESNIYYMHSTVRTTTHTLFPSFNICEKYQSQRHNFLWSTCIIKIQLSFNHIPKFRVVKCHRQKLYIFDNNLYREVVILLHTSENIWKKVTKLLLCQMKNSVLKSLLYKNINKHYLVGPMLFVLPLTIQNQTYYYDYHFYHNNLEPLIEPVIVIISS